MVEPYYKDGLVEIYHGDCREILPLMPKVDLVLTDPPYGVEWGYESFDDTFEQWQSLIDFLVPWSRLNAKALMLSTSKIEGEAYIWKHYPPDWRICWHKGALSTRSFIGFKDWEPIFVWGRAHTVPMHDHFNTPPVPFETYGHPCPKPDVWAKWLIARSSKLGHVILDPFTGSGTTLVAAKYLDRKAIGIEIEERYCEIAAKRCESIQAGLFDAPVVALAHEPQTGLFIE